MLPHAHPIQASICTCYSLKGKIFHSKLCLLLKSFQSVDHNTAPFSYPAASHSQESKGMSHVCPKNVQMDSHTSHSNRQRRPARTAGSAVQRTHTAPDAGHCSLPWARSPATRIWRSPCRCQDSKCFPLIYLTAFLQITVNFPPRVKLLGPSINANGSAGPPQTIWCHHATFMSLWSGRRREICRSLCCLTGGECGACFRLGFPL